MNVIAFIPARGGSKSIPLKNIRSFCGKPLLYWNILALEAAGSVDRIVVATDSLEIKQTVASGNFKKVEFFDRSAENAQDHSSTESVMLEYLKSASPGSDDLLLLCQATTPFTTTAHFEAAIKQLRDSRKDSLLTCSRQKKFYWSETGVALNYNPLHRPRRQDFNGTLVENGAFYLNSVKNILQFNCRLSGQIEIFVLPEYFLCEIDEEDDWLIAEILMKKHRLSK